MLTQEMNVFLTRTGPGTPMGELFRRYWIPALLDWELPERDCPPVRVKLLGEKLVAFRDTEGRYGLMDEFCAHRGVSLWFGRNEECGLRCSYHGWKYDVAGQCLEIPSEPEGSRFASKIKLRSYPLVERGCVLWTYMGPDETCWAWSYDYHPTRPLSPAEVAAMRDGKGIHVRYVPGTYRPLANRDNDYLIDRSAQRAGRTFSGVEGIAMQDASLQESMGPIVDRTKENLVSTDNGIIMARHRLLRALKAFTDNAAVPPGVDPAHQKVRSAAIVLPPDVPFTEGARDVLIARPEVAPASV